MSLILEDDNYVASKPHIFQNLPSHENNLHVCPVWLAASLMPRALSSLCHIQSIYRLSMMRTGQHRAGIKDFAWQRRHGGHGLRLPLPHPGMSQVEQGTARVELHGPATPWAALQEAMFWQVWDLWSMSIDQLWLAFLSLEQIFPVKST